MQPHAVACWRLGHITWTLSAPIDPATVHSGSVMVFGRWSGVMSGTRSLENGNTLIGNGTYGPPASLPAVGAGSCAIFADLNGDEDVEVVGIDELADLLFFFDSPPLPHQHASLGAGIQINGTGGSPGFGGSPALPVARGSMLTAQMLGHAGAAWLLAFGFRQDPGFPTPAGTLGLAPNPGPVLLINGQVNPAPLTVPVPPWLPPGLEITLQGLATNPANLAIGVTFSNPITIVMN